MFGKPISGVDWDPKGNDFGGPVDSVVERNYFSETGPTSRANALVVPLIARLGRLFIMSPHTYDFYSALFFENLIDYSMLDINSTRICS